MFACFKSLVRMVVGNGVFAIAVVLFSIYNLIPVLVPAETGSHVFESEHIKINHLDILESSIESGAYDTAPENILEANDRQLELLRRTQGNDIADSLKAQAESLKIDIELYESGNLSADPVMLDAKLALLEGLASLDEPVLYKTTSDEPMLYRMAELFGSISPFALFVPPVAIAFVVFRGMEDDRMGFQIPLSRSGKLCCALFAVMVVSLIGFILAIAPSVVASLVKNGMGDPCYPVVLIQGGVVIQLSVIGAILRSILLWVAIVLFVASVMSAAFSLCSSATGGCLFSLALGFVPSIPRYFDETFALRDLLPFLPTTYLQVAPVAGSPNYINLADILPVPGVSWELGMIVLVVYSAAFFFIAFCLNAMRGRRSTRVGRGAHARI